MAGTDPETSAPDTAPLSASLDEGPLSITFTHHGTPHTFSFPPSATLADLSTKIHTTLSIPPTTQKFMITPQTGLLKPPFAHPTPPLSTLLSKKILLLAPTPTHLASVAKPPPPPLKPAKPTLRHHQTPQQTQAEATYTIHALHPLPHLPHPTRSHAFLTRLRSDPGIKKAMSTHRLRVALLTEMDPRLHTTHASRTLGLNRNRGEVIELVLRTDAGDGYRDYYAVRDVLCHELAHNVHGAHDRGFWELCRRLEGEVRGGDWRRGGRRVEEAAVFYEGEEGEEEVDGGGWVGGEFVLGGGGGGRGEEGGGGRREAIARAAEERRKREREVGKGGAGGGA